MADKVKLNTDIRDFSVLLILADGTSNGITDRNKALDIARSSNLDLVLVSPARDGKPAVCKLMDYNKLKYEDNKKKKKSKNTTEITKEIRVSYNIDPHDLAIKHKQIVGFLGKKNKVRYVIELHNREKRFIEDVKLKVNTMLSDFVEVASWTEPEINDGKISKVIVSLSPKVKSET